MNVVLLGSERGARGLILRSAGHLPSMILYQRTRACALTGRCVDDSESVCVQVTQSRALVHILRMHKGND